MEQDELHINGSIDKLVCNKHFNDKEINSFIRRKSLRDTCDYCEKRSFVANFDDVMEFIMSSISNFYDDAANFLPYNGREGGYLGSCYDPHELIEEIGLEAEPYEVLEDIIACIDDISWSKPDHHYGTDRDDILYSWNVFKKNIKHTSRFLFNSEDSEEIKYSFETLNIIGSLINDYKLVRTIKAGTIVYRCHQHKPNEGRKDFKGLISAPNELSKTSNRFSPAGISMFYCSEDNGISILEILDGSDSSSSYVTTGTFRLIKDVEIIDFTKLPKVPSIFGLENKNDLYMINLLHDFVNDFTQEIKHDGREHRDYVPTQVVTEYLRYTFNSKRTNKVEGIIYPSAKNLKKQSIVFFWNHDDCFGKVNLIDQQEDEVNNIFNNNIGLKYKKLDIKEYNSQRKYLFVYKFELFSGLKNYRYLDTLYIKILTKERPFNLFDVAKDLEPTCTFLIAKQNNILVDNTIV